MFISKGPTVITTAEKYIVETEDILLNNKEGKINSNKKTTIIDKVELGNDITSETITFKSKRLGTNKLILTKDTGFYTSANSNANCPSITENENILDTNYKHTAVKDYSNNLILNAEHGNVIINVKDPAYQETRVNNVKLPNFIDCPVNAKVRNLWNW